MAIYNTIPSGATEDESLLNAPTKKPLLRLGAAALVMAFALGATVAYVAPSKSGVPSAAAAAAFKSNSRQCISIADGIYDKQCPADCDQVTKCDWCDTLYKIKGNVEGTIECGGSGPRDRFLDVECIGEDVCRGVDIRVPDFDLKMNCRERNACAEGRLRTGGDLDMTCGHQGCRYTDFTSTGPLVASCRSSQACREATFSSETSINLKCETGNEVCLDASLSAPRVTLTCGNQHRACEGIRINDDATMCTCTGTGCPPECPAKVSRVPMMALDAVSPGDSPAGADAATAEKESRVPMMALDAVSPAGADAATAVAAKSTTPGEVLNVPLNGHGTGPPYQILVHWSPKGPSGEGCALNGGWPGMSCWIPMPYTHGSDACHNFCQTMLMEYSNVPGAPHGQTPCFGVCQRNCGDVFGGNFEPDCEPSAGPGSPDTCTGWGMRFEHRREHNGEPVDLYCHNEWYYGVTWTNLA